MNELPVIFDEDGLVAAVVQDDASGAVLMLAYMNATALEMTRSTGRTHFWSRSRAKLWKKGETSGHEQIVKSIHLNCYKNSLLIRVEQIGAACHTGFPTCYYRELTPANELVETETRWFDPHDVYGAGNAGMIAAWLGAYQWLADHDLADVSGTSRLLRSADMAWLLSRVSDELRELGGVLSGEHRHSDPQSDVLLEGAQVLYWLVLAELRSGRVPSQIADLFGKAVSAETQELSARIANLSGEIGSGSCSLDAVAHRVVEVVTGAAQTVGLELRGVIEHDLADLRSRPYLAEYFAVASV